MEKIGPFFLWSMKLIGDAFNLIMWFCLKTVSGPCITYLTHDQSIEVICRLLLSRTRASSSFNSIPYVEVKNSFDVYIPNSLNHVCIHSSMYEGLRHDSNFKGHKKEAK